METKLIEKDGVRWVEIRTSVFRGCNIQIFVSVDGGWIKSDKSEYLGEQNKPKSKHYSIDTSEYNIRWSQNSAGLMTFEKFDEILAEIEKAKVLLRK
jgi:hypothetical protein